MSKIFINTMGCQMNVYDSMRILDAMKHLGFEETQTPEDADFLLINTCHIREKATDKVFSELGRFNKIKQARKPKTTIIGLAGCVVQAFGKDILSQFPAVDIAVGPQSYHLLPELVTKFMQKEGRQIEARFTSDEKFDSRPKANAKGPTAFLAIQEGCDHFCSYCVVPYTRGCEYSRSPEEILEEAKILVDTGAKEIMLLGQNVDCYHGKDKQGREHSLADLFHQIAEIDGLERLRYTTSYTTDITDEIISAHRDIKKLMPYIHLPIQSGSNKILKSMNRKYTTEQYLEVIEKLRKARSDIAVSSDFIVGFPGETDEDFEDTMRIVEQVKYAQSYSFKYSPRPGTPASLMKNQIDENLKLERLQILQSALLETQKNFNLATVGKTVEVLFTERGKLENQWNGYSPYLQNVHVTEKENLYGKICCVKIVSATATSLSAELVR
ncbi:MAG: tRNA (N6-isopentenyl adenosine(37)-C2)-methylthiotransferase MiaB [Alphaproteobacteria bacterium]|nr:tRNA (N6-isopentenyl adenosine(37)-C2)-methylthiotransferase MiaB [Alphaproteobacteria bacterium]